MFALALVQGLLLLTLGGLVAAFADEEGVADGLEVADAAQARATGIVLLVVGAIHVVLAVGVVRGRSLARSLYGIAATVQTGIAVYALVALRDARAGTVWSLTLAVVVLWLLYGSEATQEYFDR